MRLREPMMLRVRWKYQDHTHQVLYLIFRSFQTNNVPLMSFLLYHLDEKESPLKSIVCVA